MYCWPHYLQMRRHGNTLERTRYTPNDVIAHDGYAELRLYSDCGAYVASTFIDLDDLPRVTERKWALGNNGYAASTHPTKILLHRFIKGACGDLVIDHINRNKLDNRKTNLRFVSQRENAWNTDRVCASGVHGVTWRRNRNKWEATWRDGRRTTSRNFSTVEEAVRQMKAWEQTPPL